MDGERERLGSIAAWLASRHAEVVAVDKDLSTYGAERPENLRLIEADILASRDWDGPGMRAISAASATVIAIDGAR